jgi:uncharacterized membrane-anchored protein
LDDNPSIPDWLMDERDAAGASSTSDVVTRVLEWVPGTADALMNALPDDDEDEMVAPVLEMSPVRLPEPTIDVEPISNTEPTRNTEPIRSTDPIVPIQPVKKRPVKYDANGDVISDSEDESDDDSNDDEAFAFKPKPAGLNKAMPMTPCV